MKNLTKILIVAICLAGTFLFLINNNGSKLTTVNEGSVADIKKPINTSTWTYYTNNQLGFSMKIPLRVPTLYRCPDSKQVGETPLKTYEDNENGVVYISPEYYYDANWSQPEQKFIGECNKIIYSLESLKKEEQNKYLPGLSFHPFLGWKIIINNPKDNNEVDKFVKQNFGSSCMITSNILQGNGNYEINIKGQPLIEGGQQVMDENCYTNFAYKILYSPEKKKMMSVILGQECTFGTDPLIKSTYQCYDEEMIKSFKFE